MKKKCNLFKLSDTQLKGLKAGAEDTGDCCCACAGPSSTADNADANIDGRFKSPECAEDE